MKDQDLKFPYGICHRNVRYGALGCRGPCRTWFHLKCLNISYFDIKKLTEEEKKCWKCFDCINSTEEKGISYDTDIEMSDRLIQLQNEDNPDLESSLHRAAELGNALLKENEQLKQEIHNEKLRKSQHELELEDKLKETEHELEIKLKRHSENEKKLKNEIDASKNKLSLQEQIYGELIKAFEKLEKEMCTARNTFKNELKGMTKTIRSLEDENKIKEGNISILKGNEIVKNELLKREEKYKEEIKLLTEQNKRLKLEKNTQSQSLKVGQSNTNNDVTVSLSLLEGEWITDDTVKMYFDLLETCIDCNNICLMNPAIVLVMKCLDSNKEVLNQLNLREKSHILIPVNDAQFTGEGPYSIDSKGMGTHWSMLLYVKENNQFLYFDSLGTYNLQTAEILAKKLLKHIDLDIRLNLKICPTPQQSNTYDCGVYMLLVAEMILAQITNWPVNDEIEIPTLSYLDIWNKRAQLSSVVYNKNRNNTTHLAPLFLREAGSKLSSKLNINKKCLYLPTHANKEINMTCKTLPDVEKQRNSNWTTVKKRKGTRAKKTSTEKHSTPLTNKYQQLSDEEKEENTTNDSKHKNVRRTYDNKSKYYWSNPTLTGEIKKQRKETYLILGDSMLKHVFVPNAKLKFFRGATAAQISQAMDSMGKMTKDPQAVVLHFGTNDLDCLQNAEDVMGAMYKLIKNAINTFGNTTIFVSSVIRRRGLPHSLLQRTNKNIRWLCQDLQVVYVDSGKYINDSCLARDGVHLNRKGSDILGKVINKVVLLSTKLNMKKTHSEIPTSGSFLDVDSQFHFSSKNSTEHRQQAQKRDFTSTPRTDRLLSTTTATMPSHHGDQEAPGPHTSHGCGDTLQANQCAEISWMDMSSFPPLPDSSGGVVIHGHYSESVNDSDKPQTYDNNSVNNEIVDTKELVKEHCILDNSVFLG
ncbi:SUMO1 sentrin specific peptidase 8 [Homalodisca vitripennis]|nr:SUMO1 sentrin specific peptidase 8 [Homalodisca vitripennis]